MRAHHNLRDAGQILPSKASEVSVAAGCIRNEDRSFAGIHLAGADSGSFETDPLDADGNAAATMVNLS
jgi:hypothetical protein